MKKKSIIILIIILIIAIIAVLTVGLTKNNNTTTEVSTSTTQEESIADTYNLEHYIDEYSEANGEIGASILANAQNNEASPTDANNQEDLDYFPDSYDIELELLSQYPELPSGCESVSLTMLLKYYGYDLDKTEIASEYLEYSNNFVMGYNGDPFSSTIGGGCYAPGMETTANKYFRATGNKHYAENITGTDFDQLLEYVAKGDPILIWTTISMSYCNKSYCNYDEEGNPYCWDYNEHCVVLAGYDLNAGTVTIYDPIDGIVYRDLESFKAIYEEMYEMAIIIREY